AITLLNQAVVAAGGPENLLVTVANPDIETAQRLFKYPGIGLLLSLAVNADSLATWLLPALAPVLADSPIRLNLQVEDETRTQ
ncbi:hypothetical protein MJM25_30085, partial [Salmonella enterica subsp. enterica serovar Lubbock]|nr:hypothetical protein [Salmonella enterica subsp. enterica serovar Lubbock]